MSCLWIRKEEQVDVNLNRPHTPPRGIEQDPPTIGVKFARREAGRVIQKAIAVVGRLPKEDRYRPISASFVLFFRSRPVSSGPDTPAVTPSSKEVSLSERPHCFACTRGWYRSAVCGHVSHGAGPAMEVRERIPTARVPLKTSKATMAIRYCFTPSKSPGEFLNVWGHRGP